MRHATRRQVLAGFAAVGGLAMARPALSCPGAGPAMGVNYAFEVDAGRTGTCAAKGRGATIEGLAFLSRYDDPSVRSGVRTNLAAMARGRLCLLRHLVWFSTNPALRSWAFQPRDDATVARCLSAFLADARDAGIQRTIVSLAPLGPESPTCRKARWGDCFDRPSLDASRPFVTAVATVCGREGAEFDPLNEGVVPGFLAEARASAAAAYANAFAVLAGLGDKAPALRCSVQVSGFPARRKALDEVLRMARSIGRPVTLDAHIYGNDEIADFKVFLDTVVAASTPFCIGEIRADASFVREVSTLASRSGGLFQGVALWPLADPRSGCHADMTMPDTIALASRLAAS